MVICRQMVFQWSILGSVFNSPGVLIAVYVVVLRN